MALCYSRASWGGGTTFLRSWVLSDIKTAREGPEFRRGRPVLQSPLRLWKLYYVIPEIDMARRHPDAQALRQEGARGKRHAGRRARIDRR